MNVKNDCSSLLPKCPNVLSLLNCGLFSGTMSAVSGGLLYMQPCLVSCTTSSTLIISFWGRIRKNEQCILDLRYFSVV